MTRIRKKPDQFREKSQVIFFILFSDGSLASSLAPAANFRLEETDI